MKMNETAHKASDGPWTVEILGSGTAPIYGKDALGYTVEIGALFDDDMGKILPIEANARIVTSAHDVLAALTTAFVAMTLASKLPNVAAEYDFEPALAEARAALAKATAPQTKAGE